MSVFPFALDFGDVSGKGNAEVNYIGSHSATGMVDTWRDAIGEVLNFCQD